MQRWFLNPAACKKAKGQGEPSAAQIVTAHLSAFANQTRPALSPHRDHSQ